MSSWDESIFNHGPRNSRLTHQLVLLAGDVRDVHVVGGRRDILELLAGEDVESDNMGLGVTVLASLGGGHFDDLAGTALDDNVTVLSQSGALHRERGGRAGVRRVELSGDMLQTSALVFDLQTIHRRVAGMMVKRQGQKGRGSDAGARDSG